MNEDNVKAKALLIYTFPTSYVGTNRYGANRYNLSH